MTWSVDPRRPPCCVWYSITACTCFSLPIVKLYPLAIISLMDHSYHSYEEVYIWCIRCISPLSHLIWGLPSCKKEDSGIQYMRFFFPLVHCLSHHTIELLAKNPILVLKKKHNHLRPVWVRGVSVFVRF